jgi:ubiquinone/menaquinone biosynthesis C-methylase UbiE
MHDVEEGLSLDERSAIDFTVRLRWQWAHRVYPTLAEQTTSAGGDTTTLVDAERLIHEQPIYPWFSAMERLQQKMMWRTAADTVLRRRRELLDAVDGACAENPDGLRLDPDLALPDWYTDYDIHIQPGSVFTDDASALVYELGARVVMMRDNDGYKFHTLFATTALPEVPDARRVVDIGCGFGKSTRPLPARYPGAEVIGIDLSAPNLRLAHAQAVATGLPIVFLQGLGSRTGLPDASVDVVTGTMVLHEMPASEIEATIQECARILRPGGVMRFLEFWPTGEPIRDVTIYEHAERNNEPYFRDLFGTDTARVCGQAGLTGHRWVTFDERSEGLRPGGYGERPEWHFPWSVLCAEKPA